MKKKTYFWFFPEKQKKAKSLNAKKVRKRVYSFIIITKFFTKACKILSWGEGENHEFVEAFNTLLWGAEGDTNKYVFTSELW